MCTTTGELIAHRRSLVDYTAFVQREHRALVGALSLYCGDRFLAEELATEALVRARERWSRVREMDSPGGWAYRVGVNLANSHFRRKVAERRALRRLGERTHEQAPESSVVDAVAVREAIASLPQRCRQVVVLRYFFDLTVAETAARLDISEGTVKSQTHRAMSLLRDRLDLEIDGEEQEVNHAR